MMSRVKVNTSSQVKVYDESGKGQYNVKSG